MQLPDYLPEDEEQKCDEKVRTLPHTPSVYRVYNAQPLKITKGPAVTACCYKSMHAHRSLLYFKTILDLRLALSCLLMISQHKKLSL